MTDKERFQKLLETFEGTPVEAVLHEMEDELGDVRAFQLVHLVLTRTEQMTQLWMEETQ